MVAMRDDMCRSAGVDGMIRTTRALLLLVSAAALVAGGGGARPRGVPQAKAPLYAPADTFTCLDGSLRLPYAFVNDDYCDCRDGTDEPGTSACLNGVFHCTNAGHEPLDVPSSRVNDGVCDCCDAADEWASGTECRDTCEQLGREARLEAQRRAQLLQAGARLRADIIKDGAVARAGMKDRLAELQRERAEAEQMKIDKEQIKESAESLERTALDQYKEAEPDNKTEEIEMSNEQEAEETFRKYDSNGDGVVDLNELQSRSTFDKNRDGVVSEEEARFFLGESNEVTLREFIDSAWPLIKPYLMMENGLFKPPIEQDNEELERDADNEEAHEDEEEEEEEHEHEEVAENEETHDAEEDGTKSEPQYDEETQRLVNEATEARNHYMQADKVVREIDTEIEKLMGMLDKDYGPKEEFATLAGQCIEFSDREYIYKLCPFDRATQTPKSESRDTNLGTWGEWVGEDDKYTAMLYSHGMSCWNGPDRSVRVNIQCGLESRITSVSEPNRCEYVFEMETPAACVDYESDGNQEKTGHDEL